MGNRVYFKGPVVAPLTKRRAAKTCRHNAALKAAATIPGRPPILNESTSACNTPTGDSCEADRSARRDGSNYARRGRGQGTSTSSPRSCIVPCTRYVCVCAQCAGNLVNFDRCSEPLGGRTCRLLAYLADNISQER